MALTFLTKTILAIVFGSLLLMSGILLAIFWLKLYDMLLQAKLQISPGSAIYETWVRSTFPIMNCYYFFNITNPVEFQSGERPILAEVGPYVYEEFSWKENIVFGTGKNEDLVSFNTKSMYKFDSNSSSGTEEDFITIVNVPYLAVMFLTRFEPDQRLVAFLIDDVAKLLTIKGRVKEFLFEGFTNKLYDHIRELATLMDNGNKTLPAKFGIMYGSNLSVGDTGPVTLFRGTNEFSKAGNIHSIGGRNASGTFEGPCAMINGSSGERFPPHLQPKEIYVFREKLCRSLKLVYEKDVQTSNGIPAFRFVADNKLFATVDNNADNWCFCSEECTPIPSGLLNVSACQHDAPIFISFPHFLHGDPQLRSSVIGMHPEKERHEMLIDVDETAGIPVNVKGRFQVNVLVDPRHEFEQMMNQTRRYFHPILWMELNPDITDSDMAKVKLISVTVPQLLAGVAYGSVALGSLILLVVLALVLRGKWMPKDSGQKEKRGELISMKEKVNMKDDGERKK